MLMMQLEDWMVDDCAMNESGLCLKTGTTTDQDMMIEGADTVEMIVIEAMAEDEVIMTEVVMIEEAVTVVDTGIEVHDETLVEEVEILVVDHKKDELNELNLVLSVEI